MTIVLGDVCSNTCFGFQPGDNTPDYFGLWGPINGEVTGAFILTPTSLTIEGITHVLNAHDTITVNPVEFPGAIRFQESGLNQFGFGVPETEYLCPTPGVPEPATWMLMLLGFALLGGFYGRRRIVSEDGTR